jgi:hypothetical protein
LCSHTLHRTRKLFFDPMMLYLIADQPRHMENDVISDIALFGHCEFSTAHT